MLVFFPLILTLPDGFMAEFFQYHWELMKADIMTLIGDFFNGCGLIKHISATDLTLIFKFKEKSWKKMLMPKEEDGLGVRYPRVLDKEDGLSLTYKASKMVVNYARINWLSLCQLLV